MGLETSQGNKENGTLALFTVLGHVQCPGTWTPLASLWDTGDTCDSGAEPRAVLGAASQPFLISCSSETEFH